VSSQLTFSVLLPVYNGEPFLQEAVESILAQTFTDFELLLLNDGSTDKSQKILESFTDHRIRIIQNPVNVGLIATLNKGIEEAKGRYIVRMDADDISVSERFQEQFNYLSKNPEIDIFGSNCAYFGGSSLISKYELTHSKIALKLLFENSFMHPTVVIKRESLITNNLAFDKKFLHTEDWALWLDCYESGLKFGNIEKVLLKYRLGTHNITVINSDGKIDRFLQLYKKAFSLIGLDSSIENLRAHYYYSFGTLNEVNKNILIAHLKLLRNSLNQRFEASIVKETLALKTKQFILRSADLKRREAISFAIKTRSLSFSMCLYFLKSVFSKKKLN
jgi:glycosyltransferase involved in cell wall biosynthesis